MSEKVKKQSTFIEQLCRYYMDFLKSGFKSTRFPKRYIRLVNEKGFKIGVDLSKYEKFNTHIKKLINKENNLQSPINVKKGEFSVKLNNTAQDLIKKLVKQVSDKDVEKIINLTVKTIKEFSVSHRNKPDEAYDQIVDIVKNDLTKILINPITEKMEPIIGSQSNIEMDSLFTLEMGLSEIVLDPLVEGIPEIFNSVLADKKSKPKEQISLLFNKKDIAYSLLKYFENFDVKDLYYDLQEIVNARKNLDKKEIYLYFSDLEIEKKRFPLFYTQINIQEFSSESRFQISFSNELFVNKLAVQYAFDTLKKDQNIVETFGEDRKIYISDEEDFSKKLNDVINTLIPKLKLEGTIDLKNSERQIAKSINFVLSNNCSICVFDKSDEALINDFEDILNKILAGESSEIVELFKGIITDFLMNEPYVITEDLEDEWDGIGVSERLNYKSPIPLNPEQLKILRALRNEKCKHVVVEGPPGTGKSHTISAIAFEYILEGKSILILSDTREALDVVENKINDTLDKVRGETNIQNPILRLGKMGNTYSKILSRNSIENIRTFHRSQKNDIGNVTKEINELSDIINDRVKIETEHYKYIDREKFEEFFDIQKQIKKEDLVINIESLIENIKSSELNREQFNLNWFIDQLHNIEDSEELIESFNDFYKSDRKNLTNFINYLHQIFCIKKYLDNYKSKIDIKLMFFFEKVNHSNLISLQKKIDEYKESKSSFLGGIFKGGKISALSEEVQSLMGIKKVSSLNLKFDIERVIDALYIYQDLEDLCKKIKPVVNFNEICLIIKKCKTLSKLKSLSELSEKYAIFFNLLSKDKENIKNISFNPEKINSIFGNIVAEMDSKKVELLKKYYEMEEFFSNSFNIKDRFDYTSLMKQLQSLYTSKMANELDGKLIKFYDSNRNNAVTLSKIIKAKQKFPKPQFQKLKTAFPCIISSVRDFAEYINLQKDLFDLIIIDEASQVSIAQAFPALIRARKILVLGDKKQFSNLQSYQAATLVNNSNMNNLRKVFKKNISAESDKLVRLETFNVKTSILDFFQNINNLDVRLKKHFRGYPEHIAYCSKTFYNSDLQAIRLRTKPINEVIKFDILDYEVEDEEGNYNKKEAQLIIKYLEKLKEKKTKQTVGIITPFTDQQKYITTQITKHPDRDYFFEDLKLKIMTFDTCQGEERQIVFYSMVACKKRNKLNTIFPVDLSKKDLEEKGDKRAQRLNVGFSRVQETMHIITSRKLDKIDGEIGNALRFINNLASEDKLATEKDVDPKSPKEKEVIGWFKRTSFYLENKKNIELRAQFPMGEYLKQLDPDYGHPKFVVDFLVILSNEKGSKQVIIEYDGLKDHFDKQELITDDNFDEFYTTAHYEREKALETYGYNFIRLNKFNTADDPVKFLDKKLKEVFSKKKKLNLSQYNTIETFKKTKEGEMKHCERCNKSKPKEDFYDKNLRSGIGLVCRSCKGVSGKRKYKNKPSSKDRSKFSKADVKFKFQVGSEYEISYINMYGKTSNRTIKIKELDTKFLKAYDDLTQMIRTFRKDRVLKSTKV